jgi:hypothetical protein
MAKIITNTIAEKTFTVAGVSNLKGVYKLRVANSTGRGKVLQANGHTDIRLIELPNAMTKLEAADYLYSLEFDTKLIEDNDPLAIYFTDIDAQQAFADFYAKAKVVAPTVATVTEAAEDVDFAEAAELLEADLAVA